MVERDGARDLAEPRARGAALGVEAVPQPQRALEGLRGKVLRGEAVACEPGEVAVDVVEMPFGCLREGHARCTAPAIATSHAGLGHGCTAINGSVSHRRKESIMGLFRLVARMTIGLLFVGHGVQKLFGWFGGGGLDATAAGFESMGLRPGRRNAIFAGAAETAGGLMFAAGAATPVGGGRAVGVDDHARSRRCTGRTASGTRRAATSTTSCSSRVFGLTENGPGGCSVDAR